MKSVRKFMIILAVIGTVLVTALFCYMPFRQALRERNKQEVSLAVDSNNIEYENEEDWENNEQGDVKATSTNQNLTELGKGEIINSTRENAPQEIPGQEVSGIVLKVLPNPSTGKDMVGEVDVELWQSTQGTCYFFLPGFAENAIISLKQTKKEEGLFDSEQNSILIDGHELKPGDVLKDIIWEQTYTLTVLNKQKETVLEAPVVFMHSSALPVLSVNTESGTMEEINEVKGNKEAGEALLFDEQGNQIFNGQMKSLSGRGNSTWGLSKKPYLMKLDEQAEFFDWGVADTYALLANGYDETGLRNELSLGLAKALGMSYVPQGQMVDLYCNGVFYGNYYLCEKVEVSSSRLDIRNMEEIAERLYRTEELDGLKLLQNDEVTRKWTNIQYEEEDLTGGYLFERELKTRFPEEISGFVTDQGDHYALQSPTHASEAQVNYIADLMQEFQDAIETEDGINQNTGKAYTEYIDTDSFIQKYLMDEITRNYDGGVTSSFFYKPQDSVSNKIFAGPVWDYDVAFGNCNLDEIVGNPVGISKLNTHIYGTDVFARLYEKEDFYQRMTQTYTQKGLPYLEELLKEGIDKRVSQVRQSMIMNHIRWEGLENRYQYYSNYDNCVTALKYFIEKRKNFLSEVWKEGVVYHAVRFEIDGEIWKIYYVKDGETLNKEPIPVKFSNLFVGWVTPDGKMEYDEFKPILEDMTFRATWQELPVQDIVLN